MFDNINQLKELISTPKKVVITTHRGPDGDAIGSSLGLSHFLTGIGHTATVITPNDYASFLHWVPGNNKVIVYENNETKATQITKSADVIFLLDFSQISRIDEFGSIVQSSNAIKVMIDHHHGADFSLANLVYVDTSSSSTAQLVYELIEAMQMEHLITKNIAECLYLGIMTDTGSFKYESTTSKTHEITAKLVKKGIENSKIHDLVYDNSSVNRIKLLGYCLSSRLRIYKEKNSAIISLNAKELNDFGFKNGDTEGFVNYALAIKGIKFAAFIAEKEGIVKLSLRSKGNIKVNEIAKEHFNGGGHINAAGGVSQTSVDETIIKIEKIINNF
mgnify:CR=1 FL=1